MSTREKNKIWWAWRRYRHCVRKHGPVAPETNWVRLTIQLQLLEV